MKKQNKISKTAGNVKAGRSALALLLTLTLVFSLLCLTAPQKVQAQKQCRNRQWKISNQTGTFEQELTQGGSYRRRLRKHIRQNRQRDINAESYGKIYDFWSSAAVSYTMTQKITLPAGSYRLTADAMGADGMQVYVCF